MQEITEHKIFILVLLALVVFDGFLWAKVFTGSDEGQTSIYFLDVGQGDGALIVTETGARILIDGGRQGSGIESELAKVLGSDRYIDLAVITHGDFDHYGGFLDLMNSYEFGAFIGNGRSVDKDSHDALISNLEDRGVSYLMLMEGDSISFGEEEIALLSPSSAELLSADLNDASLVFLFDGIEFDVFFTGDAGVETERRLAREYDLRADVLKVGHHGSRTSSDLDFLRELSPLASVISVGENTYGHPHGEVVDSLSFVSSVFRTDEQGSIRLFSEAGNLLVEAVK